MQRQDAAPLDPVFWRGVTGAHGALIAQQSLEYPIDGILYDTEHYAGGMMYLQNSGFSDETFETYLLSRKLAQSVDDVPAGTRYRFLAESGRLPDYNNFLEEQAYQQGRELAVRWHDINPHLIFGIWPLLDNWYSQGFLRGLGGAVPSLGLSGVEYYHGAEQTQAMADYFQSRNGNLMYMPGFYPPYAYAVEQLGQHVELALRTTGNYWMLGPHEELVRDDYQSALAAAHAAVTPPSDATRTAAIELVYRVEQVEANRTLVVDTKGMSGLPPPSLSLWAKFGGAALCKQQPMQPIESGEYQARIPLLRRISNNRFMPDGFRSGACYQFEPVPREFQYEDPYHTKLFDGRAYGYFGSTVVWSPSVAGAQVLIDLHREYRVARVEIAQPTKLEDRIGGPTQMQLQFGDGLASWSESRALESHFAVSGKDYSEPDTPVDDPNDPRHGRAWLSWRCELDDAPARWLRLDLQRTRANSSISLGEFVIWAQFDGEVEATVEAGGRRIPVERGWRTTVAPPNAGL